MDTDNRKFLKLTEERICSCEWCMIDHPFYKKMKSFLPSEDFKIFDKIFDENFHNGEDLSYYKCIMDGSWPSSVEILKNALDNAIKVRLENHNI